MSKITGILGGGIGNGAGTGPVDFVGQDAQDETPNVEAEEQQQYDAFMQNAAEILYREEGEVEPEILKRLSTGKKPIDTLAQTTVWLVMLIEQDATRNQMDISDDVIMHAGREVMELLVEIAEAAGIHEFKNAEIQGAWYQALDMYREANSDEQGRMNPEELAGAFEALKEADNEGRADEVVPGFEQNSERAIAMAMADQNEEEEGEDNETKRLHPRDRGSVQ